MLVFFTMILVLEVYKYFNSYHCWEYCYAKNEFYSYSEFICYDLPRLRYYTALIILFCYFFYLILIINIIFSLIFLFTFIKIKKKKSIFYNIFLYYPFLITETIKHVIKKKLYNRYTIRILFINYVNILLYGFPRIVLNYSFISVNILKSYKKNPENNINLYEVLGYIYDNTYEVNIEKMEKLLNTLYR